MKANTSTFSYLRHFLNLFVALGLISCNRSNHVDPIETISVLKQINYTPKKPAGIQGNSYNNYIKFYSYNIQTKQLESIKSHLNTIDAFRNDMLFSAQDSIFFTYDGNGFLQKETHYSKNVYYSPVNTTYSDSYTTTYIYKNGKLSEKSGCCAYEYNQNGTLISNTDKLYHYEAGKLVSYVDNGVLYLNETDNDGFITTSTSDDVNIRQSIGGNLIRKYTYNNGQRSSMTVYWGTQLKNRIDYEYDESTYAINFFEAYPNIVFKGHPTNIQNAFGLKKNNIIALKTTVYDSNGQVSGTTIDRTQFFYDTNGFPIKKISSNGDTTTFIYQKL